MAISQTKRAQDRLTNFLFFGHIANETGSRKTVIVARVVNASASQARPTGYYPHLVIMPASVVLQKSKELHRVLPKDFSVVVYYSILTVYNEPKDRVFRDAAVTTTLVKRNTLTPSALKNPLPTHVPGSIYKALFRAILVVEEVLSNRRYRGSATSSSKLLATKVHRNAIGTLV